MDRHFNIWTEGYEAYDEGKCWQDNPYIGHENFHTDSDKAVAWQYGWEAGLEDAEQREMEQNEHY